MWKICVGGHSRENDGKYKILKLDEKWQKTNVAER